ncbi:MAG: DEAD/DEAH box helicase family protein [Gammaproteobacteria bacterium]|nr:DEAD/DEAH box helicase family protein [Gammaproteobacteria bacterium]
MAQTVIAYDRELPEIPDRRPWEKPSSFLLKDETDPHGWRIDTSGRRPSDLLLVTNVRKAVDAWRAGGYQGASEVTSRLFHYWFLEDHAVSGFDGVFRYHFCQQEAVETLAWLVEIAGKRDIRGLIKAYAGAGKQRNANNLLSDAIRFETAINGERRMRWGEREYDLPPENLRRYAFKMATGAGKTWVMAMIVAWAALHKRRVPDSPLSTNFLIVAPNVIVFERLEKDFASNRIFHELPLIPPEWRDSFSQNVILRGDASEPSSSGNLFLTNIQQLYEFRDKEWTPANAVEALLGKKPAKDLAASGQRSMLERMQSLKDLIVLNDEAHHVHHEDLAWSQSLLSIHKELPQGLSAWLDFSATPKDQQGRYFPWTVCDYPLAQAVEDRIVKAPIIVTKEDDSKQPANDPDRVTGKNAVEKYAFWIDAAVQRWKAHRRAYRELKVKPVLFIMAERNPEADAIGRHLWETREFGFKQSDILVIHTDSKTGEVRKSDLEKARRAARNIDQASSRIKVVVSVMMLREGWDVRNVSVVLGLRPYTAKSEILPEQVIGRGLRLMKGIGPDQTQTLEALGTRNLLKVVREQLEAEGVGVVQVTSNPALPITVAPVIERSEYDIAIPITKPSLGREVSKLSLLSVDSLAPIYKQEELSEPLRISLAMEFATTETEVHAEPLAVQVRPAEELLADIANKIMRKTGLTNCFADLYPIVRGYVSRRCFGKEVDAEDMAIRSHLGKVEFRDGIADYLARKIGQLTAERNEVEFERADFRLSMTEPFGWRRNLPLMKAKNTIFNYVATYNDFERRFAEFLDEAPDVVRFAALGTTDQGDSGSSFHIDYLKPSGAIGFYYPDWVAVQKSDSGEVNWIIETKGRVWMGTKEKDDAMEDWCLQISKKTGQQWQYLRVDQSVFGKGGFQSLQGLAVKVVAKAMFAERNASPLGMTREEVHAARDEGRA